MEETMKRNILIWLTLLTVQTVFGMWGKSSLRYDMTTWLFGRIFLLRIESPKYIRNIFFFFYVTQY